MAAITFSEFISDEALTAAIEKHLETAKEQKTRLQIEIRTKPPGAPSQQEGVFTVDPATTTAGSVRSALERKLQESPGEEFEGSLRLNFRPPGATDEPFGSWTRTLKVEKDNVMPGSIEERERVIMGYLYRTMNINNDLVRGVAEFMRAVKPGIPENWGPLPTLLTGLATRLIGPTGQPAQGGAPGQPAGPAGVAHAPLQQTTHQVVMSAEQAQYLAYVQHQQQLISTGTTPAALPAAAPREAPPAAAPSAPAVSSAASAPAGKSAAPLDARTLSAEQIKEWARANPAAALQVVNELAGEMG